MTFLELAKRLRQECAGSGDGPASVTTPAGEDALWVSWVNQAYYQLQSKQTRWNWMWEAQTLPLVAGTQVYALSSPTIQPDSFHIAGDYLEYRHWRDFQAYAVNGVTGKPGAFSVRPDNNLVLDTLPDQDYTLSFEHYRLPALMAANDDIPLLPERYHMLIVYLAMRLYAAYENAPEILSGSNLEYQQMMALLSRDTLPEVELPGALA